LAMQCWRWWCTPVIPTFGRLRQEEGLQVWGQAISKKNKKQNTENPRVGLLPIIYGRRERRKEDWTATAAECTAVQRSSTSYGCPYGQRGLQLGPSVKRTPCLCRSDEHLSSLLCCVIGRLVVFTILRIHSYYNNLAYIISQ
jgi:hypothetical protein